MVFSALLKLAIAYWVELIIKNNKELVCFNLVMGTPEFHWDMSI